MSKDSPVFPDRTKAEWLDRIIKDLKGGSLADLERHVGSVKFPRFAHPEDLVEVLPALSGRNEQPEWLIAAHLSVDDPGQANQIALEELNGGVNELWFDLGRSLSVRELDALLEGIDIRMIGVHWRCPATAGSDEFITWWQGMLERNTPKEHSLGTPDDPIHFHKERLLSSSPAFGGPDALARPEESVMAMTDWLWGIALQLDGNPMIAKAIRNGQYRARLITPVGTSMLWEVARLRALRVLLSHLGEALDLPASWFRLDAISSSEVRALSPNDHKIMTPVAGLSAICGSVDALCLEVPDQIDQGDGAFHRRIARNVHHLMISESGLHRVIDPAAGSYFFETLTERIASKCWDLLQQKGG